MKRLIKSIRVCQRAKRLFWGGQSDFDMAVRSCVRVSAVNHKLSFMVERVGTFGGPEIHLIQRPEEIIFLRTIQWRDYT